MELLPIVELLPLEEFSPPMAYYLWRSSQSPMAESYPRLIVVTFGRVIACSVTITTGLITTSSEDINPSRGINQAELYLLVEITPLEELSSLIEVLILVKVTTGGVFTSGKF